MARFLVQSLLIAILWLPPLSSASTMVGAEVTRYYQSILRRAPDLGGQAFWESEALRLQSEGADLQEVFFAMGISFFSSPEYQALDRGDLDYIEDLYRAFFNRPSDSGGRNFWAGELENGLSRQAALLSFLFSAEFQQYTARVFGPTKARAEKNIIMDFFRGAFSRLPDTGGLNAWVTLTQEAQCTSAPAIREVVRNIAAQFFNSLEYAARKRSDAEYVDDLYNAFLRRGGDLAGTRYWIDWLGLQRSTRDQMREAFLESPEFNARLASVSVRQCVDMRNARFVEVPNAFPDLGYYYDAVDAGTDGGFTSNARARLDLDGDGHSDLLIQVARSAKVAGEVDTLPVANRLIALLGNGDATFRDGTEQVFGTKDVILNGNVRVMRLADLNNDGRPEVILATHQENGRRLDPSSGSLRVAKPQMLLSEPNGRYSVISFGDPGWYHAAAFARGPDLAGHLLVAAFSDVQQTFEFTAGAITSIGGYPTLGAATLLTIPDWSIRSPTAYIFTNATGPGGNVGLSRFARKAGDGWELAGSFYFDKSRQVPWVAWNADVGTTSIVEIEGEEFVAGGFSDSCQFRRLPWADPMAVVLWSGLRVKATPADGIYRESDRNTFELTNKLLPLAGAGEGIALQSLNIRSEPANTPVLWIDCFDLNSDGFEDIVLYPAGLPLIAYLNDGKGNLSKARETPWPASSSVSTGWYSPEWLLIDGDNDGVMDVMVWPGSGGLRRDISTRFKLYRGFH